MRCSCGREYEGDFCPNCGKPNESSAITNYIMPADNNKANNSFKKIMIGICVVLAIFFLFSKCGGTSDNIRSSDNIKSQLSSQVTSDYLPGTYQADNGETISLKLSDESVLHINATLAKWFKGNTMSVCQIAFSKYDLREELGTLDVADKTIQILGDQQTSYSYQLSGNKLTLTDWKGKKISYKKISDEYNADLLFNKSALTSDNLVGTYYYSLQLPTDDDMLKSYESQVGEEMLSVEKADDKTVNICLFYNNSDEIVIRKLAENVPIDNLYKEAVCLKGVNNYDLGFVDFLSRYCVRIEEKWCNYVRGNTINYSISKEIKKFKSANKKINYDYSTFTDTAIVKKEGGTSYFSFNKDWYKQQKNFRSYVTSNDIYIDITVSSSNDTVKLSFDNGSYYSFNKDNYDIYYSESDLPRHVTYHCDQDVDFEFCPFIYNSSSNTYAEIRFVQFDAVGLGYNIEVDGELDFSYFESHERQTGQEKNNKQNETLDQDDESSSDEVPYNSQAIYIQTSGTEATLYLFNFENGDWVSQFKTDAVIGSNGVTDNKEEGDKCTPLGAFEISFVFGLSKPETNMTFKKVKKDTVWIDDPDSVYYNTWQSTSSKEKDWESSEALYSRFSKKKSNYCIAFNFNGDCISKNSAEYGKGSAIFIDGVISEKDLIPGYGDIKISAKAMKQLLALLDSDRHPFVQIE